MAESAVRIDNYNETEFGLSVTDSVSNYVELNEKLESKSAELNVTESEPYQGIPWCNHRKEECRNEIPTNPLKRICEDGVRTSVFKKTRRCVSFCHVYVFYFKRQQGFICIPDKGGITLGMEAKHCHMDQFSITEYESMMEECQTNSHRLPKETIFGGSSEEVAIPADEEVMDSSSTEYYAAELQTVSSAKRRALLLKGGVEQIDPSEKELVDQTRVSRSNCGCRCRTACHADTCSCARDGIECQVDKKRFPCRCTARCGNPHGRKEYNQSSIKWRYLDVFASIYASLYRAGGLMVARRCSDTHSFIYCFAFDNETLLFYVMSRAVELSHWCPRIRCLFDMSHDGQLHFLVSNLHYFGHLLLHLCKLPLPLRIHVEPGQMIHLPTFDANILKDTTYRQPACTVNGHHFENIESGNSSLPTYLHKSNSSPESLPCALDAGNRCESETDGIANDAVKIDTDEVNVELTVDRLNTETEVDVAGADIVNVRSDIDVSVESDINLGCVEFEIEEQLDGTIHSNFSRSPNSFDVMLSGDTPSDDDYTESELVASSDTASILPGCSNDSDGQYESYGQSIFSVTSSGCELSSPVSVSSFTDKDVVSLEKMQSTFIEGTYPVSVNDE